MSKEKPFIGPPPSNLLYWGNTILLGFIGCLIGLASWITYPEFLWAEIEIVAGAAPVEVVAQSSGRIIQLFHQNNDVVKANTPLAVLESDADWEAISALHKNPDQLNQVDASRLGSLGNVVIEWQQENELYQQYIQQSNIPKRIETLENQIQQLNQLNASLEQQKKTLQTIIEISLSNVARQKELIERGASSYLDLENAQSEYLQLKQQQETINLSIIDNEIKQDQLQLEQMRLTQQEEEEGDRYRSQLRSLEKALKKQIESWKQQYLILAPIDGRIQYLASFRVQQFIAKGAPVLSLIPENGNQPFFVQGQVSPLNSGKIQPNMQAFIRLDGFPHEEFGQIPATIRSISVLPQGEAYIVEMDLPNGNQTTYQRQVPLRSKLSGQARIILERKSLLDRIVAQAKGFGQ